MEELQANLRTILIILGAMAILAAVEAILPLHARKHWNRAHLGPNLALTFLTFVTNAVWNAALILGLAWCASREVGLLRFLDLGPLAATAITVIVLDFATYVTHVSMHKLPLFWRFHSVHHADPAVDVTTTVRQHPGEGVIRYLGLAAFALPLGASPAGFALYRLFFAVAALLSHANIPVPARLDDFLALVVPWPTAHKVHHSRDARFTNTNYGILFTWWDRLFGTFTPARVGRTITYGLSQFDDPAAQTTAALLAAPFSEAPRRQLSAPVPQGLR